MRISDEQIDKVFDLLPDGPQGFMTKWGYQQFARRILSMRAMPLWEPEFDVVSPTQESLAIKFSKEINEDGCDSVRLLEMAQKLYKAERDDKIGSEIVE